MHRILFDKTIFNLIIKDPLFNSFDNFLIQKMFKPITFCNLFLQNVILLGLKTK